MKFTEMRCILRVLEVSPLIYTIEGEPADSTWCIKRQGKTWLVFFFERGSRYELQRFHDENSACVYFLNQAVPDWEDRVSEEEGHRPGCGHPRP